LWDLPSRRTRASAALLLIRSSTVLFCGFQIVPRGTIVLTDTSVDEILRRFMQVYGRLSALFVPQCRHKTT
jgi:hypothetical protein